MPHSRTESVVVSTVAATGEGGGQTKTCWEVELTGNGDELVRFKQSK